MGDNIPTVLVVDDSATQLEYMTLFLKQFPFHIITAASGVQCLQLTEKNHIDLVILDVEMPHFNGYQVTQRLKRDPKTAEIPVVLLSAAGDPEDIQTGYDAGANAYIHKGPFAEQYLTSTLKRMGLLD